eukprot:TRINITY_DN21655_c0_g1_i1.p1 TRINITY_DN21655_c0_g1~~TRINITY_DN21655_c0_g1_i1.p1  ORF type:complete len:293 (+),score=77.19 TRINITY_DN21655_c0_g1_i1:161-1039(+)
MATAASAAVGTGAVAGSLVKECNVSEARHASCVRASPCSVKANGGLLTSGFVGKRLEGQCTHPPHGATHTGGRARIPAAAVSEAVAVDNAAPVSVSGTEAIKSAPEDTKKSPVDIQDTSAFISDVANLIKLVDSRDIVELELKHKDYEIVIRKKEALSPPKMQQSQPGMHVMAHTSPMPYQQYSAPPPPPAPAAIPVAAPAPAPPAAPAKPASSIPPMLSPMAGTVYRSPAPGEKAFVQIGDQVKKGQVVCIIEAMKLMNEIEADQSGTIMEILVDDGKAVSIDTPLFTIKA